MSHSNFGRDIVDTTMVFSCFSVARPINSGTLTQFSNERFISFQIFFINSSLFIVPYDATLLYAGRALKHVKKVFLTNEDGHLDSEILNTLDCQTGQPAIPDIYCRTEDNTIKVNVTIRYYCSDAHGRFGSRILAKTSPTNA